MGKCLKGFCGNGRIANQNQEVDAADVFADTQGKSILLRRGSFNAGVFTEGFSKAVFSPLQRLQY